MQLIVNGEAQQHEDGATISELLAKLEITSKRLAVEVNLEIVPRSDHASHRLMDGDRLEIVHAIGGG